MRQPQQYGGNVIPNNTNSGGIASAGPSLSGVSLSDMLAASSQRVANANPNNRPGNFFLPSGLSGSANSNSSSSGPPASVSKPPRQTNFGPYNVATPNRNSTPNGNVMPTPVPSSLTIGRDPRPLRDKNYINMVQQKLFDYLQSHNFSQETQHPLTTNSLRKPTQKDFVMIFKWLYNKLDPGYKFTRSIESDVFLLLKILHYPYLDAINKSQISAVGGQSWPIFLGMLYWMMELNMTLEVYDSGDYEGAEGEISEIDQIINKYVVSCYVAFMNGDDMESLQVQDLLAELDQLQKDTEKKIENVEEECRALERQLDVYDQTHKDIQEQEMISQSLQVDIEKYKEFNANLKIMKEKWKTVLEALSRQMTEQEAEIKRSEEEIKELEQKIANQELNPKEIDSILTERDRISQEIQTLKGRTANMEKIHQEKEKTASDSLQDLKSAIENYTNRIYSINIDPESSLGKKFSQDPTLFTISLGSPLSDDNIGQPLGEEQRIRSEIKPQLLQYRDEISDSIHTAQDEYVKLQESLDRIQESNAEKRELVQELEAKLNALTMECDTLYETANNDIAVSNSEIERRERELQALKLGPNHSLVLAEQRLKDVTMVYENMKRQAQLTHQSMEDELEKMLNTIISFKVQVQKELEDYEKFAAEEWETAKME